MKEYVAGFYFNGAEVLLIEKKRPSWQAGKLNGIGGHIEKGETPIRAMVREFEEETGVVTTPERWTLFCGLRGAEEDSFRVWFFRAMRVLSDRHPESKTDEVVRWVNYYSLGRVLPNLKWLLPMASVEQSHDWPFNVIECAKGLGGS